MFLSRLGKRERYFGYITVLIIGLVVFDRLILQPVLGELAGLNDQIDEKGEELRNSLGLLAQKDLIDSEYKKYTKNIKQNSSNEEEISNLLSEIEKIAKKTDVSLTSMKPSQVKEKKFYKEYIIKIDAEGVISRLVEFMYNLEKTSKLIRIGKFRLIPKHKKSRILKMDMVLRSIRVVQSVEKGGHT